MTQTTESFNEKCERIAGYKNAEMFIPELIKEKEMIEKSKTTTQALQDVIGERKRQIEKEGWSTEHDDDHCGQLAVAGACYALNGAGRISGEHQIWKVRYFNAAQRLWPFDIDWWKPKDARQDLVRAAALLIAEIERMDRAND